MHIILAVSAARLLGTGVAWFPKATISASVNVKSHKCRFSSWYAATLALVTSAAPFCNTNFNAICAALLLCAYDVIISELIPNRTVTVVSIHIREFATDPREDHRRRARWHARVQYMLV